MTQRYNDIFGMSFDKFVEEYDENSMSLEKTQDLYAHLDRNELVKVIDFALSIDMKYNVKSGYFEYPTKEYFEYARKKELVENFTSVPKLDKFYSIYSKGYGIYIRLKRQLFYKDYRSDLNKILDGEYEGITSEIQYRKIKEIVKYTSV